MIIHLILSLFMMNAHASDDWLCKEASSVKRGNSIYACGSARGGTDQIAKMRAFDAAQWEFDKVCRLSSDCKNHKVTVEPQRTTCDRLNRWYVKCYRLVVFTME